MKHNFLIVFLALVIAVGCTEIEEPQLDDKYVEIFVPRDSLVTDIATQLFYWYEVDGAAKYELQIVTPSFDRIDRLVLDTNTSNTKFNFTLQPGVYEWSVRAYNNSSSTGYTVHALFIDSTLDLSNQEIVLTTPKDKDTSNQLDWLFGWQNLYNAEGYELEIWHPDLNGLLIQSRTITTDTAHFTVPTEGNFLWRVRAQNSLSQTAYRQRTFYVDTTRPAKPILLTPLPGQIVNSNSIDFTWQWGSNSGSSLRDTMYFASDSLFIGSIEKYYSNNRKVTLENVSSGVYYWGVRSYDKAGNKGFLSNIRQITVQ